MALKTRLTKQNCSARADTHSRCRFGAAGAAAAVFLTLLLAAALFAGAGAALVEYTEEDDTIDLWVKGTEDKYTLSTSSVSQIRSDYGGKQAYKIRNATELEQAVGSDIYILTADIYFNDSVTRTTSVIPTFKGTLIGNGYTIYNLTIKNSTSNFANPIYNIGLIGTLDSGTLNYVQLSNAEINTTIETNKELAPGLVIPGIYGRAYRVGGLVGNVSASSGNNAIIGCSVLHSDISGFSGVGALVGYADGTSNGMIIARCNVANCSISSQTNDYSDIIKEINIAGLVGCASGKVNITDCDVANCSITSRGTYVGGLVGYTEDGVGADVWPEIAYCNVTNCIVLVPSWKVGGLAGVIREGFFKNCTVTNCTLAATDPGSTTQQIGSLVGEITKVEGELNSQVNVTNNTASYCAVAGKSSTSVQDLIGQDVRQSKEPNTANNVIVDNSSTDCFIYLKREGSGGIAIKSIGINPVPYLTVKDASYYSYDSRTNLKYTILGKYGHITGFGYVPLPVPPRYVTFYNDTADYYIISVPHGSVVSRPDVDPERTGYTFRSWNMSGAEYDFSTPVTEDISIYANRTANTYNVTFNNSSVDASGTMKDQVFTYDAEQALSKNNFTRTGFTFKGWNATSPSGIGVDYADQASVINLTAENNGIVTLYAVWEAGTQPTQQPTPQPTPQPAKRPSSGGGSSDKGTSVWLTAAPTQVPVNQTAEPTQPQPTVSLTQTPVQTPASPAPFAGILAGLGAAAVLFGIRRK